MALVLWGAYVAAGDVNRDGKADIITGTHSGPPVLSVFSGATGARLFSFNAYSVAYRNGVRVASGDIDGDGFADIITSPASIAGGNIRVFNGRTGEPLLNPLSDFVPFPSNGAFIAVCDVNNDGKQDLVAGADGNSSYLKVFSGNDQSILFSFPAYGNYNRGVHVSCADTNADGFSDIIASSGTSTPGHVKIFNGRTGTQLSGPLTAFVAFPGSMGGLRSCGFI